MIKSSSKFEDISVKIFPFLILFLIGYDFVVPVDVSDPTNNISIALPFWAQKIQIIHGVFLSEVLIIAYVVGALIFRSDIKLKLYKKAKNSFVLICALCFIGVLSSLINMQTYLDIFEALRILLLAIFFWVCLIWGKNLGSKFIIRAFLIGATVSTIVNLVFTFSFSWRMVGILPLLLGQNGPGSSIGFMIGLSSILFLMKENRFDSFIAIFFLIIGLFALLISFSKIGILMGFLGLFSWAAVLMYRVSSIKAISYPLMALISVFATFVWLNSSSLGNDITKSAHDIYNLKLGNEGEGIISKEDEGDIQRIAYYLGVGEILLNNPLFGVSYSGFRGAIMKTNAFSLGTIAEDTTDAGSNPHNSFLYYASANGLPGLIIVSYIFLIFYFTLKKALKPFGRLGFFVCFCIVSSAFILGNTTPGLFNTHILYIPLAFAFSKDRENSIKLIK